MPPTIHAFAPPYEFLSNFHPCRIWYGGELYLTVEHAFQAAKTLSREQRQLIQACYTPGQAKRAGQKLTLRPDWETRRVEIMLTLLRRKFRPGSLLAEQLLATGDTLLEEGNTWQDRFWGISPPGSGQGQNMLGRLLMQVRRELAAEPSPAQDL